MGVPIYLQLTKNVVNYDVLLNSWHHLTPQHLLLFSPIKNYHNHHGSKNGLCNTIFIIRAKKPIEVKGACHTDMFLEDYSVCTNEN